MRRESTNSATACASRKIEPKRILAENADSVSIPGASTSSTAESQDNPGPAGGVDAMSTSARHVAGGGRGWWSQSVARRLWSGVLEGSPFVCWPWARSIDVGGYGRFKIGRVCRTAHSVAYELAWGPVPPGAVVRHRCHNRACCNPWHLELGSHADNMRDMVGAQRSLAGERNPRARLTATTAAELRQRYQAGEKLRELAAAYGVHYATAWCVVRGKTWRAA